MAKQNRSHRKLTQPWPAKAGYGKAGKQNPLSNFPTASTNTKYNYLWDTGSEGKVTHLFYKSELQIGKIRISHAKYAGGTTFPS
jgi:hypothetical protein